eukprot:3488942-Rhodomonas_salina.2
MAIYPTCAHVSVSPMLGDLGMGHRTSHLIPGIARVVAYRASPHGVLLPGNLPPLSSALVAPYAKSVSDIAYEGRSKILIAQHAMPVSAVAYEAPRKILVAQCTPSVPGIAVYTVHYDATGSRVGARITASVSTWHREASYPAKSNADNRLSGTNCSGKNAYQCTARGTMELVDPRDLGYPVSLVGETPPRSQMQNASSLAGVVFSAD